jgi:hypothetical protein
VRPRFSRWLSHSRGRLPGNTTTARNIKDMVVVAPFATQHKRYNHRRLSCNQLSCIAMAASHSLPCDAMKNIWLVVAWCDLASLVAINLRCHRFLQYDVPRYARCRLFCGQPRTSVLKADCCEGNTHREPGVRYGSDSMLRKRGGSPRHRDCCPYDNDHGSDLCGQQRSGVDCRKEQSRVWHADCAGRRRPRGAVRGDSPKPPKGDTCGYGPPLGVRSYQLGAWRRCLVPTLAH